MEGGGGSERVESSTLSPRRRRGRLFCLVGLALVASALTLVVSRQGAPLTSDSAAYVGTAHDLDAGLGLTVPIRLYPLGTVGIGTPPPGRSEPVPTPLVIYAPLAPVLLAVGGHPLGAARLEDAVFFGLTILLVGLFVLAVTDELWVAAVAQLLLAFSLAVMASDVGTVAAALFFAAVALVAVLRLRQGGHQAWLAVAAVAIGLATLERYASGGLIIWSFLVLRHRLRQAVTLLALSSAPLVGWFVYEQVSGRSTGHYLGFHVVKTTVRTGLRSFATWVLPASAPFPVAVLVVVIVGAACLWWLRRRIESRLLLAFVVVQVVILEIAITFFDAGVNLDATEFVPLGLAVVVAVACRVRPRPTTMAIMACLVVAAALRFGIDTATHPGLGYASAAWVSSPVMADVRRLPDSAVIYTNAPDAVYLLADRATATIPETTDFSTLKANPHFTAQLDAMRRTLADRGGYVVYVRGLGRSAFVPSESLLVHDLRLSVVANTADGAVYRLRPLPTP